MRQRIRVRGFVALALAALLGGGLAVDAVVSSPPTADAATAAAATAAATGSGGGTVVVAAGDIAEGGNSTMTNARSTGDQVRRINPAFVLVLGDAAYADGSTSDFLDKYDPTWGSFKAISRPTPGNHEWHTLGQGYFDYFFGGNPTNWYAYDIDANWRAYALSCEVSCAGGSTQEQWLKADLAAHPGKHYIAYTHEPRYTSGAEHSDETELATIYNDLVAAGGDIFLSGHNHDYERFAKMDGNGHTAANGLRTFVVGTGGNQLYNFTASMHAGEEFRQNTDYGVLQLTLGADGYDWAFVASGRGWVNSSHVDTGRTGAVLDSGHEATNRPAPAGAVTGPATTTSPATTPPPGPPSTTATTSTPTTTPGATGGTGGPAGILPSYILDGHDQTAADNGFSIMDVSPGSLSKLPAGTRGMVWLGDLRSGCTWDTPDADVSAFVSAHKGDASIAGYNIADEPDDTGCATAPQMLRARTDLIHAADPEARTFAVFTEPPTFAQYAPTVDIPAIDPYPCREGAACDPTQITSYANALKAAIGNHPWWAVLQAFSQSPWRWPTPDEERAMITSWCTAGPSGFTTFAWSYNGNNLANQTGLLAVIAELNRGGCPAFGVGATPSTTTVEAPTTSPEPPTTAGPPSTDQGSTTTVAGGTTVPSQPATGGTSGDGSCPTTHRRHGRRIVVRNWHHLYFYTWFDSTPDCR